MEENNPKTLTEAKGIIRVLQERVAARNKHLRQKTEKIVKLTKALEEATKKG